MACRNGSFVAAIQVEARPLHARDAYEEGPCPRPRGWGLSDVACRHKSDVSRWFLSRKGAWWLLGGTPLDGEYDTPCSGFRLPQQIARTDSTSLI